MSHSPASFHAGHSGELSAQSSDTVGAAAASTSGAAAPLPQLTQQFASIHSLFFAQSPLAAQTGHCTKSSSAQLTLTRSVTHCPQLTGHVVDMNATLLSQ